jgi:hypothetical protein
MRRLGFGLPEFKSSALPAKKPALAILGSLRVSSPLPMKRQLLIAGIIVGVILALAPFLGMVGAMFSAFHDLSKSGIPDHLALSSNMRTAVFFRKIGLVACPVGLGLFIFCIRKLHALRHQPPPLPPP